MKQKILISILNYNNSEATKKCIKSVLSNIIEGCEVLVIDNNSTDGSFLILKEYFKKLNIIKSNNNGGYASGHKISVDYAIDNKFDFIWILNNDLIVKKETLKELISAFNEFGLGIYGSISLKSENPDIINFGGGNTHKIDEPFEYNSYEDSNLEKYYKETQIRKVQSIEGSSMFIPVKLIIKYGFMRLDYFMYAEETDYCYRLSKLGISSYVVPKSIIIHGGGESLKSNKYLESYYRRRNMLFFEKEHYNISVIRNIHRRIGILNFVKFIIKGFFFKNESNELYYLNMANIHALFNKRGKLNDAKN